MTDFREIAGNQKCLHNYMGGVEEETGLSGKVCAGDTVKNRILCNTIR